MRKHLHFLCEYSRKLATFENTGFPIHSIFFTSTFQWIFNIFSILDLDPVMEYLSAFYSPVSRPAKNQVQIIRSFILMVMLGFTSLTAWLRKLKAGSLLALLAGCNPDSLPPLGRRFSLSPT